MKKVVIHKAGSYDQLRLEEVPDPSPGPDEVVIDVRAIESITRMSSCVWGFILPQKNSWLAYYPRLRGVRSC